MIAGHRASIAAYLVARHRGGLDLAEQRTAAVIVAFLVAWWVLVILARPLDSWRWVLVTLMGASLVVALALGSVRHYFDLVVPPASGAGHRPGLRRGGRRRHRAGLAARLAERTSRPTRGRVTSWQRCPTPRQSATRSAW